MAAIVLIGGTTSAWAQETIAPGEAFATRFSGTVQFDLDDGSKATIIDEGGIVGSAIDVRNPGFAADGRHWVNEPQHLEVTAGEVGQVFGIAIDNAEPVNIYITATSAFGLHMFEDESDWLPGQWGPGGPGGVYKLNGASGYAPELIATIGVDGRPNTGAALGNIVFDPAHNQLFVSDLESGLIHRISTEGSFLSAFDHGVDGRTNHYDAIIGSTQNLDPVSFDPEGGARIGACTDGTGAATSFAATPGCWNFADFRRRVWGMAIAADPNTGQTRLYYGIWGTEGFGNPEWGGDDAVNTIWSVGLDTSGEFVSSEVRLEIALPGLGEGAETPRAVSDIAIANGVMLVAERGGVRNLGLEAENAFAVPSSSRVLRYVLNNGGVWEADERYDVGFNDRRMVGAPYIRAGAAGGVDFGVGYDANGVMDSDRPLGTVWMTGDSLCSPNGPCVDPGTRARTDTNQVHGLQGTPIEAYDELLPEGTTGEYPADGSDPYPADSVLASYLIDLDQNLDAAGAMIAGESVRNDATRIGDVEIVKAGAGGFGVRPVPQGYDLEIDKTGEARCLVNTECTFTVTIRNNGPADFVGPLFLWDVIQPFPADVVGNGRDAGWACYEAGNGIHCQHEGLELSPGETTTLTVTVAIPNNYDSDVLTNCVSIAWIYTEDGVFDVRPFQIVLTLLGYDPGPIDGRPGPRTTAAIARFQEDNGLFPSGEIDAELARALFPGLLGIAGDLDSSNDQDCHDVQVGDPRPQHTKWKSHLKAGSPHSKVQSHLKVGSPHNKVESHLKFGSPHQKVASHLKSGSPHDKRKSHLKVGSPHKKVESHLKSGSPHKKVQSHLKDGSPHDKRKSHLKVGSPHSKVQSHNKDGSPHQKAASHLKTGSPHDKRKSHLKVGSPHDKRESHLKTGSPHQKAASHLKDGSPHRKDASHLKTGSPHQKAASHLKDGSPHDKRQSHLKTGSPHQKAASHLKTGSPHRKDASHLKTGSPHRKDASHLKDGSPHDKRKSHLKTGTPHQKAASHLKTGSPHNKAQSHQKQGSTTPHNKVQSHQKDGSGGRPHNKVQSSLRPQE